MTFVIPPRLPRDEQSLAVAAARFVRERAPQLRIRPGLDDFTAEELPSHFGIDRVHLQQTFRKIPILGSDVMVTSGPDGAVHMINGRISTGVMLDTRFHIGEQDAAGRAKGAVQLGRDPVVSSIRLVIAPRPHGYALAYDVRLEAGVGQPMWQVLIDAVSGKTLSARDVTAYYDGDANIYPVDDSDYTSLTGVTLHRLNGSGTALAGSNVTVHHGVYGPAADAAATGGHFSYTPTIPDTTHFDEANVYYHVDHFLNDFLGNLGLGSLANPPIVAVNDNVEGSYTFPSDCFCSIHLAAKDTTNLRDNAKTADIIYHETMHVVTFSFGILNENDIGGRAEPAAMHEGFSDYFAAAATGDPRIGERAYRNFPNGVTRVDGDTSTYNYSKFDVNSDDPHVNGMIWSGALWDLRHALGSLADQIIFESLAYLPAHPTFSNGLDAILQADVDLHSGTHVTTITSVFTGRRIVSQGVGGRITGPLILPEHEPGTYVVSVNGGLRPYTYAWYVVRYDGSNENNPGWQYPATYAGSDSTLTRSDTWDFRVRAVVTDAASRVFQDSLDVGVVSLEDYFNAPTAEISGPASLSSNVEGAYVVAVDPGGHEVEAPRWEAYRFTCGRVTEPTPFATATADTFRVATDVDFLVQVSATDAFGRGCQATKVVTVSGVGTSGVPYCFSMTPVGERDAVVRGEGKFSVNAGDGGEIKVRLYDVTGRVVRDLVSEYVGPGAHNYTWSAAGLRSGVYFLRLSAGRRVQSSRVLVLH